MVRRWSYLNQINLSVGQKLIANSSPNSLLKGHHQVAFKATTYYRKPMYNPTITKLTRKSFFRRKHLNSWFIYQNILTLWAKEYLFFRKYSRVVLSFFFFKNNFLTYNLLVHTNSSIEGFQGLETLQLTHLVRSVTSFCQFNGKALIPFFKYFKGCSWFWGSSSTPLPLLTKVGQSLTEPLYSVTPSNLDVGSGTKSFSEISVIFNLFFQSHNLYYVELYKLFIYLTLLKN